MFILLTKYDLKRSGFFANLQDIKLQKLYPDEYKYNFKLIIMYKLVQLMLKSCRM